MRFEWKYIGDLTRQDPRINNEGVRANMNTGSSPEEIAHEEHRKDVKESFRVLTYRRVLGECGAPFRHRRLGACGCRISTKAPHKQSRQTDQLNWQTDQQAP